MKVKKIPMRTCVVTHEKLEKKDLLRVVRNNEGKVFVDDTLRANGRGDILIDFSCVCSFKSLMVVKSIPLALHHISLPATLPNLLI